MEPSFEDVHSSRPPRVLVVDDDPEVCGAMRSFLMQVGQGVHVQVARRPAEAIQLLQQAPVDVVLSDQNMPDMDGTHFVAWVKEAQPGTLCVLMSANVDMALEDAAQRMDVVVLKKPFSDRALEYLAGLARGKLTPRSVDFA